MELGLGSELALGLELGFVILCSRGLALSQVPEGLRGGDLPVPIQVVSSHRIEAVDAPLPS